MAKGTRITVDLGSEELLKSVKFAAVEQGESLREIVIEALNQWLERSKTAGDRDYQAAIQAINKYRKNSGLNSR
ncbi:MAG: hypothetical protein U9R04_05530 [Chloroflexota bacterium]|nr:hypothetical protein [Chloroflexota bacterium]